MLTLALTAVSAWAWPVRRAGDRVARYRRSVGSVQSIAVWARRRAGWGNLLLLLAVPVGAVLAGVGGACAALALACSGRACHYWQGVQQRRARSLEELAGGLRLFIAQLRTGVHPSSAAEGAAAESPPDVAHLFREITTTARLGGDVAEALIRGTRNSSSAAAGDVARERGRGAPAVGSSLRRPRESMARCWNLAERHGAGLAELLESVRRDLEAKAAFRRRLYADMAGPRATAVVLTALPVLGVALGEAAGAHPIAVLRRDVWGQVLLVMGVGLMCSGAVWTVRLTEAGS